MIILWLSSVLLCAFGASVPGLSPEETNSIHFPTESVKNETIDLHQDITVFAEPHDVTYFLYTQTNSETPEPLAPAASEVAKSPNWNPTKKTVVIIHGWIDDHTASVNRLIKNAILKIHDLNVIVVDWSPVAKADYLTAMGAVVDVGNYVGAFLNDIMEHNRLNGSSFMLIGHSLGAHIAGNAGSVLTSPADHIVGLDPAAPLFTVENNQNRLDATDAQYVQIIHTNGRFLGFSSSIGHADFYPNGGMIQNGCGIDLLGSCSHQRAFEFLAEAIEFEWKFVATKCDSYANFQKNKCSDNRQTTMGEINVDKTVVGDYFLNTNKKPPFAQ